jgi:hypothetical protein
MFIYDGLEEVVVSNSTSIYAQMLDPLSPNELNRLDDEMQLFLSEHQAGKLSLAPIPPNMELLTSVWTCLQAWRESLNEGQNEDQ